MTQPSRLRTVFLVAALGVLTPVLADPEPLDSKVVESAFRRDTKGTLGRYFSCEIYKGSAYEKIATGNASWVRLAEQVIAYTDACYTEGIQAALGAAMRKAPRQVLKLVDKTPLLSADHICLPFISAEQPVDEQLGELAATKRVIWGVRDRSLTRQRKACLSFFEGLETELRGANVRASGKRM